MIKGWEMDYSTGEIIGDIHDLWAGTGGIVCDHISNIAGRFTKNTSDRLLRHHICSIEMDGIIS